MVSPPKPFPISSCQLPIGNWKLEIGNAICALLFLPLFSTIAAPPAPAQGTNSLSAPDYGLGDIASEDIVTPIQLVVIDPDDTAALKQKEGLRVPVICRYYTNAAAEVETEFRFAF